MRDVNPQNISAELQEDIGRTAFPQLSVGGLRFASSAFESFRERDDEDPVPLPDDVMDDIE